MKVKTFEFNPLAVNTYVLSDETGECVIIDPSCFYTDEKETLLNYIIDNDLVVKHLLNTHLHFDHVFGNFFIASHFDIKPEAHKADEGFLSDISNQLRMFGFPPVNEPQPKIGNYLHENDVVEFGNQKLHVFHIPGHSPGSVVFYDEKAGAAFVGDVLFNGSIGRTDLPGGSYEQLIDGIYRKLFVLPNDTTIYSGHGPTTTIGDEKKYNPYVGSES